MNIDKDHKKIPVNMTYQLLPIKEKLTITGFLFTLVLAMIGVTETILSWSTLILIGLAFIVAFTYWYFTDVLIESGIKSDAREALLNEIYKDVKYIRDKMDGKSNGQ